MRASTYAKFVISAGIASYRFNDGSVLTLDAEDLPKLLPYSMRKLMNGYVLLVSTLNGIEKSMYLHRFLSNAAFGQCTDHRDRNRLNNCKSNLRLCTAQQNRRNNSGSSLRVYSKYKGVAHTERKASPWKAYSAVDGKYRYLGVYATEDEAAMAYNDFAVAEFGEFACLNAVPGYEVQSAAEKKALDAMDAAVDAIALLEREQRAVAKALETATDAGVADALKAKQVALLAQKAVEEAKCELAVTEAC